MSTLRFQQYMNSIRLTGRHLVHSQTTRKVRILVCRKIASCLKDTYSNIIHSIWPKAGAYFRGRSYARFDSSYAVKKVSCKREWLQ